jgi:hypothetical protein
MRKGRVGGYNWLHSQLSFIPVVAHLPTRVLVALKAMGFSCNYSTSNLGFAAVTFYPDEVQLGHRFLKQSLKLSKQDTFNRGKEKEDEMKLAKNFKFTGKVTKFGE